MTSYYFPYTDFVKKISSSIPPHWETKRAKAVFDSIDERSEAGEEMLLSVSEHKGVVPRKDLKITMFMAESYEGFKLCNPGDVVVNSLWAWGRGIGVSEYHGIVSTAYGVFRLKDKTLFNPRYLNYLLRTKDYVALYFMRSKGIWISRLQLLDKNFLDLPIICPPIKEQNKIVESLDSKSEKINHFIQKKQQFIGLLNEQRQSIINQVVTKGIDLAVKMKPSGVEWLGDVPEHWKQYRLRKILKEGREGIKIGPFGSSLKLEDLVEKGIKVYGQENIIKNNFEVGARFLSEEKFNELSVYEIFPNDILITKMGTTGKCKVVPENIEKGIMDSHLIRIRIDEDLYLPELLALQINDSYFIKFQLEISSKGSIMSGLNSSIVKNLLFFIPPLNEQKNILDHIKIETQTIDTAIAKAEKEIELIKEYKEAMIAEAVMGKMKN